MINFSYEHFLQVIPIDAKIQLIKEGETARCTGVFVNSPRLNSLSR
jgi:hypothetical protein